MSLASKIRDIQAMKDAETKPADVLRWGYSILIGLREFNLSVVQMSDRIHITKQGNPYAVLLIATHQIQHNEHYLVIWTTSEYGDGVRIACVHYQDTKALEDKIVQWVTANG